MALVGDKASVGLISPCVRRPPILEEAFMADATTNSRIAELFRQSAERGTVVKREEIVLAAGSQLDPLKRVRRNGGARDILEREGIEVLYLGGGEWQGRYVG
jgi:hypothetical protein